MLSTRFQGLRFIKTVMAFLFLFVASNCSKNNSNNNGSDSTTTKKDGATTTQKDGATTTKKDGAVTSLPDKGTTSPDKGTLPGGCKTAGNWLPDPKSSPAICTLSCADSVGTYSLGCTKQFFDQLKHTCVCSTGSSGGSMNLSFCATEHAFNDAKPYESCNASLAEGCCIPK